jgi:broad specificity phosphatase PhoE
MNIYLVRHGETDFNRNKIHQFPTTPLSLKGIDQVKETLKILSLLKITRLYSSNLVRTKQTADIIGKFLDLPVITASELEEIQKPSEIIGKKHNAAEVLIIKKLMRDKYIDENWHFSDEENFLDVKQRVNKFMQFLTNLNESENILIVTHAYIIKMFFALAVLNIDLTPKMYLRFYDNINISNNSLSKLEYSRIKNWKIIFLNSPINSWIE